MLIDLKIKKQMLIDLKIKKQILIDLKIKKGLKFMRTCACAHPTDHVTSVKLHLYKV